MAVLGCDNDGKITYRDETGEVVWENGVPSSKGEPNLNLLDLLMRHSFKKLPNMRPQVLRDLENEN